MWLVKFSWIFMPCYVLALKLLTNVELLGTDHIYKFIIRTMVG